MQIHQICHTERNDKMNELVGYARGCSWQGTGSYFADCLEDDEFDSTEKVVVAYDDDRIIGFAALVCESCIEDSVLAPWLDFLYVDEKYRNKGIAKSMVDYLFRIASADGTEKVYLCTVSHEKMYEKLGFTTLYKTKTKGEDECFVMQKHISISEPCK